LTSVFGGSEGPLRAAVLGVGNLGRHHARILSEMDGVELVAVADPNVERGEAAAKIHGCRWVEDGGALIDLIDFAVVAVPTPLHLSCALPLLEGGVACLVEKPLAPSPEECGELIKAAKESGVALGVGHVERFDPSFRRALELGIEPRFVEAHRLTPYPFRGTETGVVLDLMIHDIDLLLAWSGQEVESIDAVGGATLSATEDIASARLRFTGGLVANLTASRLSLKAMRRFRVFGPDCYLSVDSRDRYALLVSKKENFDLEAASVAAATSNPAEAFSDLLNTEELSLDDDEPLRAELEAFRDALVQGSPLPVTGEDGLKAVTLAHRVLEAMKDSCWGD